jgi:hypothetical protein
LSIFASAALETSKIDCMAADNLAPQYARCSRESREQGSADRRYYADGSSGVRFPLSKTDVPQNSSEVLPELDERTRQIMEQSDSRHAAAENVSFEAYRRRRYDELNIWVQARKAVYLDMKYWIWLRDPDRSPFPAEAKALLAALGHGVETRRLFCPVSYSVFLELMRIRPIDLRLRQAKLMDEFRESRSGTALTWQR